MTKHASFEALARAAAELNADDKRAGLVAHWSDDPRYRSKEHYDAVMAGQESLEHPNGSQTVKSGDIDYHAAKRGYFGGLWNSGI